MTNRSAYIVILIPMIIWSSSFLITKFALDVFQPITLVTLRISIAVVLLLCVGFLTKTLQKIDKKEIKLFLFAGFLQPFFYFICEAYGLTLVSPTVASVILSTIPLFAPILAYLLLRERVTAGNIIGIIVSLIGVLLIVSNREQLEINIWGLILLMGSVFSAILYTIILRKVPSSYSNLSIVFYIHAFSLLFFIPMFFLIDFKTIHMIDFRWEAFMAVFVLAAFSSVLSYILFVSVVRKIGVVRANAFCNIQPGCTAILMFLLFGEQLGAIKWLGIFLVIVGLLISQLSKSKKEMVLK